MLDRSPFLRVTAMIKLKRSHVVLSYNRALIFPLLLFQVRFPDLVLWSQISAMFKCKVICNKKSLKIPRGNQKLHIEGQIIKIWSQETGQTTIYQTLDRNQGSRNMNHTNTCVSIAHGFHQLYGFIL
jgi:hypothetical protein